MPTPPHQALPIRIGMDDSDSPSDVVDALFLGRFASGEQPHSAGASLDSVKPGLTLLPPEVSVLRSARDKDRSATLAELYALRRGAAPTIPSPMTAADGGLYL